MLESTFTFLLWSYLAPAIRAGTNVKGATQFYGYGTNVSGLPLIYAGQANSSTGIAYLGTGVPPGQMSAINITLTHDSTNASIIAEPLSTNTNWTTTTLYINADSETDTSAGFLTDTSDVNTTMLITEGFQIWGRYLIWMDANGQYTSKWWAYPTEDAGIYALHWNSPNKGSEDGTPIALKNLAPAGP